MFGIDDVLGGIIGLGGDIIGSFAAGGQQQQAQNAFNQALQQIQKVGAPPELAKQLLYQQFSQAGLLTPALEQKIDLGVSQVSQIKEDPSLRNAQVQALNQLQQLGNTGLNATDRLALNQIRQQVQADTEAKRQQIIQNMQARGQAGSGAELAAQLQASQSGANSEANQSDQQAAMAQNRALQAMQAANQAAGNLRNQDFGVNQAKAAAADQFRQFDVQNQIGQQQRNVGAQNTAQQYNINNAQNISNANTDIQHQQENYAVAAPLQNWQNQLGYANNLANAYTNYGNQLKGQAQAAGQSYHQLGQGAGQVFGNIFKLLGKNNNQSDNTTNNTNNSQGL